MKTGNFNILENKFKNDSKFSNILYNIFMQVLQEIRIRLQRLFKIKKFKFFCLNNLNTKIFLI